MRPRLLFLGTGAAGGTPGQERSRRRESSAALIADDSVVLFDLTRHFAEQAAALGRLDAVVLTHAHRDAAGGIAQLRRWLAERAQPPVPVYAHPDALDRVAERHRRLDHCALRPVRPGEAVAVAGWQATNVVVPHSRDSYVTTAWRLDAGAAGRVADAVVYASDVATPTSDLAQLAAGAGHLVIDGATWKRRIFSHLRIDEDLPQICGWNVGRIWLTQIGRSAPAHGRLAAEVAALCERAAPAYDGLEIPVAPAG